MDIRFVWKLRHLIGPAHAAHFVTLETVKQALGGNADAKHHPFVAGMAFESFTSSNLLIRIQLLVELLQRQRMKLS